MKYATIKDLLDWGLIFEINRRVLHPLGLALAVLIDDDGNVVVSPEVWDAREDPEGFLFEKNTFDAGQKKFLQFLQDQGAEILDKRQQALGFIEQEEG